ncbi:isoleucine--tRNA ligase [Candidatus Woesearchaeota archaeon]|nr:isoleucine--tRNA ligase [Candidatus Woesearchaeota archaeon]
MKNIFHEFLQKKAEIYLKNQQILLRGVIMKKYNATKIESDILKFWDKNKIYEKANKKNKGNEKFYFLDGPPYTSGKVHIGTAWNKSLKDIVIRYKRKKGFDVWDRAGYDMHGLPTEGRVQKKLGMKSKEEILKYGLDKFIKECKKFAVKNMEIMNKDFKRLGVWMDFENAYQSIKNEYIEGTWWLVKKAHEKNRLYEGQKTMTWCAHCQTSLAKHELEYKNVVDKSIFVKFKVKSKENEYLIIWTTTPWTIPFNLAVMVHPDLDYIKAKVQGETWIIAKGLAGAFIKGVCDKDFEIIEEVKGKELEGIRYSHPFDDTLKDQYDKIREKSDKVFSVVLSEEYVDLSAGTGLVHTAPGCGPEDYEVGHREGIPPFNTLDESGIFSKDMGEFKGLKAKRDDDKFIEALETRKNLVAVTEVEHDYAHCDRCKHPVIYKTTTQWFFKIEDLKEKMRKLNEKCYWVPDWAGSNQFDSWLENLRDNGITRQRFWGSPLPIWRCKECSEYVVVESRKELKKLGADKIPEDIHKPWIDKVTIPCKCGSVKEKIPDIMDVWIDAGTASWSCLHFPHEEKLFKELYPADFILEGKDQIRGWFNLLFVASMISMENMSFDACYMHGFVNDAKGRKMSKSLGNVISPYEVIDEYGADTFRYYTIGGANPGVDLNYNFDDVVLKRRNLGIFWNLSKYMLDIAKTHSIDPSKISEDILKHGTLAEKYMMSKLNSTIKNVSELMDKYYIEKVPEEIEKLYLSLSRNYIQMVREKINTGTEEEVRCVLYVMYKVMIQTLKMFSIVCPFITEKVYQIIKQKIPDLKKESIHLYNWPEYDKKAINPELESHFDIVKEVIQSLLNAREKAQLGIRWPLLRAIITTEDKTTKKAIKKFKEIIKDQTNIKEIIIKKEFDKAEIKVKVNFKTLGPEFGELTPKIISKIAEESDSSILKKLKKGSFEIKIGKEKLKIIDKHLIKEKKVPNTFEHSSFSSGDVYINKQRNNELQSEGFSRELIRRIQRLRKSAGLEKTQQIELYVKAVDELKTYLIKFEDYIKERVGAKKLTISSEQPKNKFKESKKGNIKGLRFELHMKWKD